ncbi:MAG: tetratricopeptide repeat protein [Gemmatimonadales bacterium]|jgi:tetratricopeptide (TPR) repeat protein
MDGKTRRSLQSLSEEVATNPNSTAFVELAAAYRERGDTERALRLCLRGLQRHPTHVEAHFELGLIYEARGERELALDEWGIVRQLAPDHVASRLALIRLYLDEQRYVDAEIELKAAHELAPSSSAVKELWQALQAAQREMAPDQPESAASTDIFTGLQQEGPGTLGVLLVGRDGQLLEGRMTRRGAESDRMLGVTLNGARSEATRVASYLGMGKLQGMVIESAVARLTVSPVSGGIVIVATRAEVPAGQAARLVQRAREIAELHLGDE